MTMSRAAADYTMTHLEHSLKNGTKREQHLARECLFALCAGQIKLIDIYIALIERHSFTGSKEICS